MSRYKVVKLGDWYYIRRGWWWYNYWDKDGFWWSAYLSPSAVRRWATRYETKELAEKELHSILMFTRGR